MFFFFFRDEHDIVYLRGTGLFLRDMMLIERGSDSHYSKCLSTHMHCTVLVLL